MIIRIIGVAVTVLSCGVIGFQIASSYINEISQFKKLIYAMDYMENELTYRQTPLPDLCRQLANENLGYISGFFEKLVFALDSHISPNIESCLQGVLAETDGLTKRIKTVIHQLSNNLGKFDIEGQINGIHTVKDECISILKSLENGKSDRLRYIKTLCLCAGAVVAILLV